MFIITRLSAHGNSTKVNQTTLFDQGNLFYCLGFLVYPCAPEKYLKTVHLPVRDETVFEKFFKVPTQAREHMKTRTLFFFKKNRQTNGSVFVTCLIIVLQSNEEFFSEHFIFNLSKHPTSLLLTSS